MTKLSILRGALAFVVASASAGCSGGNLGYDAPSVQSSQQVTSTLCAKIASCYTPAELENAQFVFGLDASSCNAAGPSQAVTCDAGQSNDAVNVQACVDQINALSCDQIKSATALPAACEQARTRP